MKTRIIKNLEKSGKNLGVAGILKWKNNFVFVINLKPPFKDWIFPSGEVKNYETPEDAILREIREETNLIARIKRKRCILKLNNVKDSKIIVFECEAINGSALPGKNIKAVGMFKKIPDSLNPICLKILSKIKRDN